MTVTKQIATKDRLADVLHGVGLVNMETAARAGCYDDYQSDSATPFADLIRDLQAAGAIDLANRAMNNEWGGTRKEAEAWATRNDDVDNPFAIYPEPNESIFEIALWWAAGILILSFSAYGMFKLFAWLYRIA